MLYLLFLQYFATLSVTSPSSHKNVESLLGVDCRRSLKNSLFLCLVLCAQRSRSLFEPDQKQLAGSSGRYSPNQ